MPPAKKKSKKAKKVTKPKPVPVEEVAPPPPVLPDNFEEEYQLWWDKDLYPMPPPNEAKKKKNKKNRKKEKGKKKAVSCKIDLAPPTSQESLDQVAADLAAAWKGDVVISYGAMTSPSSESSCPLCHQKKKVSLFLTFLSNKITVKARLKASFN